jgi:formylglycine-generating enzyme required for sulfatase activity
MMSQTLAFAFAFMGVMAGADNAVIAIPEGMATVGSDQAQIDALKVHPLAKTRWYADETPKRKVIVKAFRIDATEVTNARYKALVPNHVFPSNLADHPVVDVTWNEADSFCGKAGGHLPTEEQWERAARGDAGFVYPWGNEFDPSKAVFAGETGGSDKLKVGSYEKEQSGATLLGGTKPAGAKVAGKSPFGLSDMAGNAWEWVAGWYDEKKGLRLLKGGSWLTPPESLRSAARLGDSAGARFNDYGFRCAYGEDR